MSPSDPTLFTPAAPTDRFCGLIILPITPPDELVPAVRIGLTLCSCCAVCACRGPNRVLDDVSRPVRNTPSQPRNAETNGNKSPVLEKAMARLEVMPEKFMTYAMPRMNEIVTIGSASWRTVRAYTVKKFKRAPEIHISAKAAIAAKSTSVPAAARKSQLNGLL